MVVHMTRTTVDINQDAVEMARAELGTTDLSENARRRLLAGFDVTRDVDGTPQEVQVNRRF